MKKKDVDSSLSAFKSAPGGQSFPPTSWDLVFQVRDATGDAKKAAMDRLSRLYFKPVRRFLFKVMSRRLPGMDRRRLESTAEELAQSFFTRFWASDFTRSVKEAGSFRAFLKVACKGHYANWCDHERVRRPGDGRQLKGLQDAEGGAIDIPVTDQDMERLFDESDRECLLEECVERTRRKLASEGKEYHVRVYDRFQTLGVDASKRYETLVEELGLKLYDVKAYLHAFRKDLAFELLAEAKRRNPDDPERELGDLGLLENVRSFVKPKRG